MRDLLYPLQWAAFTLHKAIVDSDPTALQRTEDFSRLLSLKVHYTTKFLSWMGCSDAALPRLLAVLNGSRVVLGLPLSNALEYYDREADSDTCPLHLICQLLVNGDVKDLWTAGGFMVKLEAGQGIVIPPGYLCGEVSLTESCHFVMHVLGVNHLHDFTTDLLQQVLPLDFACCTWFLCLHQPQCQS